MSMIQRVTTWSWLALHTPVAQRAKGSCGGSPRRLPRNPGFDYSNDFAGTDRSHGAPGQAPQEGMRLSEPDLRAGQQSAWDRHNWGSPCEETG
jgi:hypothetical protein